MWFDILKVFKIRKFEEVLKRKISIEMRNKIERVDHFVLDIKRLWRMGQW